MEAQAPELWSWQNNGHLHAREYVEDVHSSLVPERVRTGGVVSPIDSRIPPSSAHKRALIAERNRTSEMGIRADAQVIAW